MGRIICLDWGYYTHRAIFSRMPESSAHLCTRMILSDFKKVGLRQDDIIILAMDNHSGINWRKTVDPLYKADRVIKKEAYGIDWKSEYDGMNILFHQLDESTPFQFISLCVHYNNQLCSLEADDIAAVICRYYKNQEVILLSSDHDWEQLLVYSNVKLFSPLTKRYKIIKNPEHILTQKILGKEVTDNLHNVVSSEVEYEKRKKIVSLLNLPVPIEDCVEKTLDILENKCYNINMFPYNRLLLNYYDIYNNNGITVEDSILQIEGRKKRNKKKKEKKRQLYFFQDNTVKGNTYENILD